MGCVSSRVSDNRAQTGRRHRHLRQPAAAPGRGQEVGIADNSGGGRVIPNKDYYVCLFGNDLTTIVDRV